MLTAETIAAWPGKTIQGRYHPALWHMLDVGAVATTISARQPLTADAAWNLALMALITLHDIGKISASFQALLSVLPTRFNTLRLWGLSSKVLIVDEAHVYDPYMEKELGHLLRFQAMLGGSAIVMTATLPLRMRTHYVTQFLKGLGLAETGTRVTRAYPALTLISETVTFREVAPVQATCRDIAVRRMDAQGALEILADGVASGAACVWIRNSVDEAIEAVRDLEKCGIAADLLHARFTVAHCLCGSGIHHHEMSCPSPSAARFQWPSGPELSVPYALHMRSGM